MELWETEEAAEFKHQQLAAKKNIIKADMKAHLITKQLKSGPRWKALGLFPFKCGCDSVILFN